jgi:hypothetical protein
MVALLYLKHAYNESDESLVERWAQDVYFQFFSGQVYFEPRLPAYSARSRTPFRCDGGQHSAVMADTVPR